MGNLTPRKVIIHLMERPRDIPRVCNIVLMIVWHQLGFVFADTVSQVCKKAIERFQHTV